MKKTLLVGIVLMSLYSCKKDYVCTCTASASSSYYSSSASQIVKGVFYDTKKKAKDQCESRSAAASSVSSKMNCVIE